MHIYIIIDHPKAKSFSYAVLDSFSNGLRQAGHTIDLVDLNRDGFNPVLTEEELTVYGQGISLDPTVKDYQQRLLKADHLALIFPIWWYGMPARLKGWLDKVLLPGFAVTTDHQPLLTHISGATVLTTSADTDQELRETYHSPIEWSVCKGTLKFCGISPAKWLNFGEAGIASRSDHEAWLEKVYQYGLDIDAQEKV